MIALNDLLSPRAAEALYREMIAWFAVQGLPPWTPQGARAALDETAGEELAPQGATLPGHDLDAGGEGRAELARRGL